MFPIALAPSFFASFFLVSFFAYTNMPLYLEAFGLSEGALLSEKTRILFSFFVSAATFSSVLLHEMGHAFVAKKLGVGVEKIALWFLGGVAVLKGMPDHPKKEAAIALAGPAVSFALAGFFFLLALFLEEEVGLFMVKYLSLANLVIGLFNLVPAFPLDGGRLLRDLVALRLPWDRATLVALRVASLFALLFVLLGLLASNFFLVVGGILIHLHNRSLAKRLREEEKAEALAPSRDG